MISFQYEHNLEHQIHAINAVNLAMEKLAAYTIKHIQVGGTQNPNIINSLLIEDCVREIQNKQNLPARTTHPKDGEGMVLDVMMETGTGKTYTYARTMFELNKNLGLFKFIVAVPRVAIKAGAVNFLKSPAITDDLRKLYGGVELVVHEVQSVKAKKNKKNYASKAIADFCQAEKQTNPNAPRSSLSIYVLVINAGMVNSDTVQKPDSASGQLMMDRFDCPAKAIAHTNPIMMIDEPHLFKTDNKSYKNLQNFKPKLILRYGATFEGDFHNQIHELTAVAAFNQKLVKGVRTYVEKLTDMGDDWVKLVALDNAAIFDVHEHGRTNQKSIGKNDDMGIVHPQMTGVKVTHMNKSKLVLDNQREIGKGERINPYAYALSLRDRMVQAAITRHFDIERKLFMDNPKIKALSLFFIDDIAGYRNKDGALRMYLETALANHLQTLIATETDESYRAHLIAAQKDVSKIHAGYFSQDNQDSDEAVEKEVHEILHDKESLLDFANPRRFIFSKWTLREGWDNPNIFQICKLRSSGSDTSKLQEVGRGLRLPVNEHGARSCGKDHFLHYAVDFTESDFVQKLVEEINQKSTVIDLNASRLEPQLIRQLLKAYPAEFSNEEALLEKLDDLSIIRRNNDYRENGFKRLQEAYPKAFQTVEDGRVASGEGSQKSEKTTIRTEKYQELKALWEKINQRVLLQYKPSKPDGLKHLFHEYLLEKKQNKGFSETGLTTERRHLTIIHTESTFSAETQLEDSVEETTLPIRMMSYRQFLNGLSTKGLGLTLHSLHEVFSELLREGFDINPYMSEDTMRILARGFNDYLLNRAVGKMVMGYQEVKKSIHPTALTDARGQVKSEINAQLLGSEFQAGAAPAKYFFNEIFYDSELERKNITSSIEEVIIYTKIPRESLRIPLIGGQSYSPDFAYIVKPRTGKATLNLIVETKDKTENDLSEKEKNSLAMAEKFFSTQSDFNVVFKKQLKGEHIAVLLREALA